MKEFLYWWIAMMGKVLSPKMSVFIVSMLPVIEERGGLILARMLHIDMWEAVLICVIGNIVPVPFILFFVEKIIHWMSEHKMSKVADFLLKKAEKNKPKIDKYGFLGLLLFVGIPLPGTGAWTGSLVAAVFDMDLKKASISIFLGILLAAIIMTAVSYGLLPRIF